MKFHLKCRFIKRPADTETPVSVYLKLRDLFAQSLLMESSDHSIPENDLSFLCFEPIAGISISNNNFVKKFPNGSKEQINTEESFLLTEKIQEFMDCFAPDAEEIFPVSGLFGHINYDAVRFFEKIELKTHASSAKCIPDLQLNIYRFVIVFDHYRNELYICENSIDDSSAERISQMEQYIQNKFIPAYPFKVTGAEQSGFSDAQFAAVIEKGKRHCFRGDVFQVVLSREFETGFTGDDFNVYRALRSVNPSQYLFYYNYGSYRLFGSSPEAQIKIKDGKASIHPIAGTYRRSGNRQEDQELGLALLHDKKENAEHTMLIDLARNDLSKSYYDVSVSRYKEIQYFSHVIHMVSEVQGERALGETGPLRVIADTFPAGTLSGAPKFRAMQLIDEYENSSRGFYGGSIGYLGLKGDVNHAIMIRSFLSKNNRLYYRAGAGVVAASDTMSELQEVNNKIAALRQAIQIAETYGA